MNPSDISLTSRSIRFLQQNTHEEQEAFILQYCTQPLKRQTVVTCISTMKLSMPEDDAISCIVVGTENKDVYTIFNKINTVGSQEKYNMIIFYLGLHFGSCCVQYFTAQHVARSSHTHKCIWTF